ncbi:MAG: ADP-ribosylglycohydrolase family protein [Bryobacteraceae bacterium]|nr:ADP-ribosylglycohydrolase family protein [Bryobacteraceae bacterium]
MRCYLVILSMLLAACGDPSLRTIPIPELRDRIQGGWAGQMIGVSFGAPTEFRFNAVIIPEDKLPEWKPEKVRNALRQDDLYVDMTFAKVLDDKGLDATTEDFGAMFKGAQYRLWHANLAARRLLRRGVPASLTGTPAYNAHANDIDFQIESDFIGLMAPGLPVASNDLCLRAGRVMNYGDGILGGAFVSGMYSSAFFEKDPRRVVEAGLASLPPSSPYARIIADVLAWSKEEADWTRTWQRIEDKWDNREACPNGAGRPFNIDAKLNGAYIALGLLYGGGDMEKTILISTRAGQDSDCNPSSAAGIIGVMLGYRNIPEKWKGGIPAIAHEKFEYTDFTFDQIVDSTVKRAIALAEKNGGSRKGDNLLVKFQKPAPLDLPLWDDYGAPAEGIPQSAPAWKWKGAWKQDVQKDNRNPEWVTRIASQKGAEAALEFEGTGAILRGPYLPDGGTADVYLDGRLHKTIDVVSDERDRRIAESLWHAFRLAPGKHNLRIVVKGEPGPGAKAADVAIERLIVFR